MIELVTLDFHNTIAHCDDWFHLEISTLPVRVLERSDHAELERVGAEMVTARYRAMRQRVMASGIEIEAIDGLQYVFKELNIVISRSEVEDHTEALMREAVHTATPFEGIGEAIGMLVQTGIRIGIVSSAVYHPFLDWTLERFGIARHIEFVITSASAGLYKSDPNLYRKVADFAGVEPDNVIHIGDSAKWDVWSPQQAGMRAVLIPTDTAISPHQHDTDAVPDYTASNAIDAARWILEQAATSTMETQSVVRPLLHVDIFTLFPSMFDGVLGESILKRAHAKGLIDIRVHNIRDWTHDKHNTADDTPYGGGAGMVMKAPPIVEAVEEVLGDDLHNTHIAIMSAGGRRFTQPIAQHLSEQRRVVLICGHYEGIDERVSDILQADELSIGDYVLTGGELPAMVIADTISRLVPGVITEASILDESHLGSNVEYPHYTRPTEYRGIAVPDMLLSGHHANVDTWRAEQAKIRTMKWRPDLIKDVCQD